MPFGKIPTIYILYQLWALRNSYFHKLFKNSNNGASTSKRSNSVQRSAIIKEESCEKDYDGISEGNYSGFHSEFVDVKEEPSVNPHVPNALQGGNDFHSYIFNASLPIPQHPNEDSSRYVCSPFRIKKIEDCCFCYQNSYHIGSHLFLKLHSLRKVRMTSTILM